MAPTNRTERPWWLAVALALTLLAGACSPEPTPPPPTRTPAPTFTPTVEVAATPVDVNAAATTQAAVAQAAATQAAALQPVTGTQPVTGQVVAPAPVTPGTDQAAQPVPAAPAAPTEAPTATPAAAEVVISQQINVRSGPGTNYNVIGGAQPGQRFPVTGKNQAGDWWQINYNGQAGWVFGQLVTTQNVQQVAIAQNIPAPPPPPPPTNTPVPQPTQPPAAPPPAEATQPPAAQPGPVDTNLPFILGNTERCDPNEGQTYFQGYVRDTNNNPVNGVCVLLWFYEPRTVKCSGCDGVGDGIWGFSPFGGPAPAGTPIEIYVVQCPSGGMPMGGQSGGFGDLTPQSPKWSRTISQSEQCVGITFFRK